MEVASLSGLNIPHAGLNKHVQQWSTKDNLTGATEHARIEAGHWAASTPNSTHHFGKVVDSRVGQAADGSVQAARRHTKQLELFHAAIPGGSVQVIRSHISTTSTFSSNGCSEWPAMGSSIKDRINDMKMQFDNLKLDHRDIDLSAGKTKAIVAKSGSLAQRRPPTRHKKKEPNLRELDDIRENAKSSLFKSAEFSDKFFETFDGNSLSLEDSFVENSKNSSKFYGRENFHRPLQLQKSFSDENIPVVTFPNSDSSSSISKNSVSSENWDRTSKMRWSLQYPNGKNERSMQQRDKIHSSLFDNDASSTFKEKKENFMKIDENSSQCRASNWKIESPSSSKNKAEFNLKIESDNNNSSLRSSKLVQVIAKKSVNSGKNSSENNEKIPYNLEENVELIKPKSIRRKSSFVTAETLKEIRNRLKSRSSVSDVDDGIVTESSPVSEIEISDSPPKSENDVDNVVITGGTGSLESRGSHKAKSSVRQKSDEWYNRRKSYGFEKVAAEEQSSAPNPLNRTSKIDSSTDSGICRSSEIVLTPTVLINAKSKFAFNGGASGGSDSVSENSSDSSENHARNKLSFDERRKTISETKIPAKGKVLEAIESLQKSSTVIIPITLQDDNRRNRIVENGKTTKNDRLISLKSSPVVNEIDSDPNSEKRNKKVEFCKTEIHFAAEPGKINIVQTDGKPPPTNSFRRRRNNDEKSRKLTKSDDNNNDSSEFKQPRFKGSPLFFGKPARNSYEKRRFDERFVNWNGKLGKSDSEIGKLDSEIGKLEIEKNSNDSRVNSKIRVGNTGDNPPIKEQNLIVNARKNYFENETEDDNVNFFTRFSTTADNGLAVRISSSTSVIDNRRASWSVNEERKGFSTKIRFSAQGATIVDVDAPPKMRHSVAECNLDLPPMPTTISTMSNSLTSSLRDSRDKLVLKIGSNPSSYREEYSQNCEKDFTNFKPINRVRVKLTNTTSDFEKFEKSKKNDRDIEQPSTYISEMNKLQQKYASDSNHLDKNLRVYNTAPSIKSNQITNKSKDDNYCFDAGTGEDVHKYTKKVDVRDKNRSIFNLFDKKSPKVSQKYDAFRKESQKYDSFLKDSPKYDSSSQESQTKESKKSDSFSKVLQGYDSRYNKSQERDSHSMESQKYDPFSKDLRKHDSFFEESRKYDSISNESKNRDSFTKEWRKFDLILKESKKHDSFSKELQKYDSPSKISQEHDSRSKESHKYDSLSKAYGRNATTIKPCKPNFTSQNFCNRRISTSADSKRAISTNKSHNNWRAKTSDSSSGCHYLELYSQLSFLQEMVKDGSLSDDSIRADEEVQSYMSKEFKDSRRKKKWYGHSEFDIIDEDNDETVSNMPKPVKIVENIEPTFNAQLKRPKVTTIPIILDKYFETSAPAISTNYEKTSQNFSDVNLSEKKDRRNNARKNIEREITPDKSVVTYHEISVPSKVTVPRITADLANKKIGGEISINAKNTSTTKNESSFADSPKNTGFVRKKFNAASNNKIDYQSSGRDGWMNIPKTELKTQKPAKEKETTRKTAFTRVETNQQTKKRNDYSEKVTLEELTKAADEILLAVNGYTDAESNGTSEDEKNGMGSARAFNLETISEKSVLESAPAILNSQNSKIIEERKKSTTTSTANGNNILKTELRSKRRAARLLHRANSREQILQKNGASSSEDIESDVETPPKPKPRITRKVKTPNKVAPKIVAKHVPPNCEVDRNSRPYRTSGTTTAKVAATKIHQYASSPEAFQIRKDEKPKTAFTYVKKRNDRNQIQNPYSAKREVLTIKTNLLDLKKHSTARRRCSP